jgi:hypothetical protein
MAIKWNLEKLLEFYDDNDCVLLSKEYKNEDTFLTYICKCGNEETKKFSAYKRAPYCKQCHKNNLSKKKSFSIDKIKSDFESQGCVLISDNYVNAWQYLDYVCVCGNKSAIQYANFTKGVRCKGCSSKRKYTEDNMRKLMDDVGCVYISQNGLDVTSNIKFICRCGRISEKTIKYFNYTRRCNECSHESFIDKVSGENSYLWNSNLTNEEREINRDFPEYEKWRVKVFKRDNYACQCCGKVGYGLNAHHKDGYHWCNERRTDETNGVTLCEECHEDFHKKYGYKNNTEKQFNEWLEESKQYQLFDELI